MPLIDSEVRFISVPDQSPESVSEARKNNAVPESAGFYFAPYTVAERPVVVFYWRVGND